MHRLAASIALWLAATPTLAADPAEGDWRAGDGIVVHIALCPGAANDVCGVITAAPPGSDGRPDRDVNNPDPKLRSRPIIGLPLMHGFRRAGPGRWIGGKIYDPDSGKTYASRLEIGPAGSLRVAGCIMIFCQRQIWKPAP